MTRAGAAQMLSACAGQAEAERIGVLAIPALGAGRKDFPVRKAGRLLLSIIRAHSFRHIREVRIVCKTTEMMQFTKSYPQDNRE